MTEPLNILHIEDRYADFLMVERHLRQNDLSARCSRVDSFEGLKEAIDRESWDLVLADYSVPQLNFQDSLDLILTTRPDLPVILVTGTVGEEKAVELLKLGVCDFVLKENLTRLVPAIQRSLKEKKDIEELRHVEARLRASEAKTRSIIENIGIGVTLISSKMEVLEMNHLMREWFPGVDLDQRHTCYRVFIDPQREAVCDNCPTQKTLQDGLVHEHTMQTPQAGGARNYRIVSSPILNASGEVKAAIEMIEDITEKLSLEAQLRQAQKMEAVGKLAGGVAHDFNNILSAIIGNSHLLLDQVKDNDHAKCYVEEIMKASERAAVLTQSLLAFSRKQPVTLAVIDLNEVIKGNEAFLRRLIREDIELKINCTGEPLTVLADRGQIEQVIMNLVSNARDAMPNGGKLSIETRPVTLDHEFVETHGYGQAGAYSLLSVSDSGFGMDKETQSRIFEPFFTTKEQGKGTGLGLSMAYGIVKKHDGFINVYSEPGTGTIFTIYLPRVQATAQVDKIEIKEVAPLLGGTETILVGEDDAALLKLSTKVLKHYGYRVIEAVDGQDAVDKFVEYGDSIDLVILDAIMPKKNGKVACDEMKILRPDLKVIFTSGYARDIFEENNTFDENTDFINKPYSPNKLVALVREMLDKK
jgi:signal transduction histidine kinase/DNA-binding response OmpR family regulator